MKHELPSQTWLDFLAFMPSISVMTEITDFSNSTAKSKFILYWGDMGSQWGVNRSVAQVHALLYLSETPLNAEQVSEELGIARSNVSNSIKELVGWRLIHRVPAILTEVVVPATIASRKFHAIFMEVWRYFAASNQPHILCSNACRSPLKLQLLRL